MRGISSPFIKIYERGRETPHPSLLPFIPRKDLLVEMPVNQAAIRAVAQRWMVCKDRWSLSNSSSVVCQSMHGSVMDNPYSSLLRSFGMGWFPAFK